jgi:tetratricopeptide (TPR) repeat protein
VKTLSIVAALLVACALVAGCPAQPRTPAELARDAAEMHRAHEFGKAIELYRQSLALHPDPGVRANLARALAAAGRSVEAAEEYKQLLKEDPSNGALWHDYGLVLEKGIKDLAAAEEALFNATKYPPKPPEASYDLGRVLLQRGRYEEAAACFEAALSFGSSKSLWYDDAGDKLAEARVLIAKQPPK